MKREKILEVLYQIFAVSLKKNDIILNENTSQKDIKEWDSLTNIVIISAVEKHFKIKFTLDDIYDARNIGQICNLIELKIK